MFSLGTLVVVGGVAGVLFWGGLNWAMEATNTEAFCISCHEMKDNVYEEYTDTIHYTNRSGVRAICTDCHVPKEWIHKVVRKIQATRELYHKAVGSISAPRIRCQAPICAPALASMAIRRTTRRPLGRTSEPARSGVRAQAVSPDGSIIDDFLILEGGQIVNVCNAPSPAATASLNVGKLIVDKLAPRLEG